MSRELTPDFAAELSESILRPILLAEFDFDSGTIFMWSGVGDLVVGGNTYSGGGNCIGVTPYQETEDVQSQGLTFMLTGVPSDLVAVALEENFQNRTVRLYIGLITVAGDTIIEQDTGLGGIEQDDNSGLIIGDESSGGEVESIIADPYLLFSGIMDTMEINDDGTTATIKVNAENVIYRLTQTKERDYTSADQQINYPGDTGLDFIPALQDDNVVWQSS